MLDAVGIAGPVLFLAPHTDDVELGCGGTISRLLEEGREVHVAAFSTAEQSLPPGFPPGTLKQEMLASMREMQVPLSHVSVFDFPVRRFSYHRQELLDELVRLRKLIQPATVFLPSGTDLHQDHHVCFNEGMRAFKCNSALAYELPWNNLSFPTQAFVALQPNHLEMKWRALLNYKTQLSLRRPYFDCEFLRGLARLRGVQAGVELAEAFEVIRLRL